MNVATRIAPTAGQLALAKKLAEGGERRGGGITHVDAAAYTDPARYEAERSKIFDKRPLVIAPSALLPEPGMAIPVMILGILWLRRRFRRPESSPVAP